MAKKLTTEEFIKRARIIHGDRYDYSLVNYINNRTKVDIICKQHGIYKQIASDHIDKCTNCPMCSDNKQLTTEEFIMKAKRVHGDKYDYSQTIYTNATSKVTITCKIHGVFAQIARNHINSSAGCNKCAGHEKLSTEEFIEKARKIHGDEYDYSKVIYINNHTNIIIICEEHGEFFQSPFAHMTQGSGCGKCYGNIKLTTEEFIIRARQIHGEQYNYDEVKYIGAQKKVKIYCRYHGYFYQTPDNHINQQQKCPSCKTLVSKPEISWLDSLNIDNADRQAILTHNKKKYKVDAYVKETNTIYEFYGDYWHGNPKVFDQNKINKDRNKTFGELYQHTINREDELKVLGYNIVSIWESDFKQLKL